MRSAIELVAAVSAVLSMCTSAVSAAPTVAMRAGFVAIRGFAHTGNLYSAGAAVRVEMSIDGEHGASPPPLAAIKLALPARVKIHPAAFPNCAVTSIETALPGSGVCTRGSTAGPAGQARVVVPPSGQRGIEDATLEAFYTPEEGLALLATGTSPLPLRVLALGRFETLPATSGFGAQLIAGLRPVGPSAGEAGVAFEALDFTLGSAIKRGRTVSYYVTLPREGRCPKAGFPFRAELTFADPTGERAVAHFHAPCPRPRRAA